MQKQPVASGTRSSNALNNGQFQQPLNQTPRQRRSPWRVIATAAVVLLALVTIFAWMLLPHLTQPSATANHDKTTPTTALATPTLQVTPTATPTLPATSTPELTQQYAFTAQDSGKTITYVVTTRFSIALNPQQYPQHNLQLSLFASKCSWLYHRWALCRATTLYGKIWDQ